MGKTVEDIQMRLAIFGIIMAVAFGVLLARLWFLQVLAGEEYNRLAQNNRIRVIPLDPPRGIIYDRRGKALVENRPGLAVTLVPSAAEERPGVIANLAKLLRMSKSEVKKRLEAKDVDPLKPRVIKEDVDKRTVAVIEEHKANFPGVDVEVRYIRSFPRGKIGPHVLGYVGEISDQQLKLPRYKGYVMGDLVGKSGVEFMYEPSLRGEKGRERLEVDASGRPLRILSVKDPVPGQNLRTTLDASIQASAEAGLLTAVRQARRSGYPKANGGAVVVLDPRNGEVLALASYPTYDPNIFMGGLSRKEWKKISSKKRNYPMNNRAVMGAYPPASTMKPITGTAAITQGITTPTSIFVCRGRWTGMGEKWAKWCWFRAGHGALDFNTGVILSCDTVFYTLGLQFYRMPGEMLQFWARRYGLGFKTGIDLPGEIAGRVPDKKWKRAWNKTNPAYQLWVPGDTVNMAIGQGDMLATPLQMAAAYAAIANGGTLYTPHIAKEVLSREGRRIFKVPRQRKRKVGVAPGVLAQMRRDLRGVVTQGTAASAFAGFPVTLAGKTGTAQVLGKDDYAWFIGFAPVDHPRYVVAMVVEQGGHGGSTAALGVRQILSAIYHVPFEAPSVDDQSR